MAWVRRRKIKSILMIILSGLVFCLTCSWVVAMDNPLPNKRLQNVTLNTNTFNPSIKEKCELVYTLNEDAKISVYVYNADFDLIMTLADQISKKKGQYSMAWDGRDFNGKVVPDEAYFFCIEAKFKDGTEEIFDPTTFSGGEEVEDIQINYDRENNLFSFSLAKPARVLMRVGIKAGPLIATLLDWESKPVGNNVVYWSGFDDDDIFDVRNHPNLAVMATAFYLPECSVITYGNKEVDYFTYKKVLKTTQKPRREEVFRTTKITPNYYYSREEDRAPKFYLELLNCPENKVKGELKLRINVADDSKKYLLKNRFEVIVYLDGNFIYEEEEGYIPFNMIWNSKGIKPGEHYLTVCLSSYLSQVASKTVKITIE